MNAKVDAFLEKTKKWSEEFSVLRAILLDCSLTEDFKWNKPCYTFEGNSIALIIGFKDSFALTFFKGVLLKDEHKILAKPGENSQSGMWIKFTHIAEIKKLEPIIKAYIYEAIEIEKAGLKVQLKKITDYEVPEELIQKFGENSAFKTAFNALTPGRQRMYYAHFSSAKQQATRISRIENNIDRIMNKKGLNDCICGLSKRMPTCDGSHKFIQK